MSELAWEDEDGFVILADPIRIYYDQSARRLACRCERYAELGRCRHLVRWRPQVTVWALEIYL